MPLEHIDFSYLLDVTTRLRDTQRRLMRVSDLGRTIRTARLPGAPSLLGRAGEVLSDLPEQASLYFSDL